MSWGPLIRGFGYYSSDVTPRASDLKRPGFQDAWVQAPQPGSVQIDWGIRYVLSAASWPHHGTKTVKNLGVTSGRLVLRGVLSESFRVSLTPLPGSAAAIWQLRKRGTFLPSFLPSIPYGGYVFDKRMQPKSNFICLHHIHANMFCIG